MLQKLIPMLPLDSPSSDFVALVYAVLNGVHYVKKNDYISDRDTILGDISVTHGKASIKEAISRLNSRIT
jgi:hypothetical protein